MMKLLTFLGLGSYSRVAYVWGNREYETDLFPEAVAIWNQPSQMLVMLTPEAKEHRNWTALRKRLSEETSLMPVDIPSGRNEEELWEIFNVLTERLNESDEVVFDVTHAFRSLPVLVLLAAAYLRVARQVNIRHLLYGAYEARDQDNRAPVFDLTPFLSLLDWVTATDKFVKAGDGKELADLLRKAHQLPWQSASIQGQENLPRHLQGLGGTLESLSHSLELARPDEVAKRASSLSSRLQGAVSESRRWAQPFGVLLERTRSAYEPFATSSLSAQRELVRWYVEHGHTVQAITLAREWLVSWACSHLNRDVIKERAGVEEAINHVSQSKRGQKPAEESPPQTSPTILPNADALISAWDTVSDLRNDVAHCGMRLHPRPAHSIVQLAEKLVNQLDLLTLQEEENPA